MTLLKTAKARCANYWIAKVADAPDLGKRNQPFQSLAFRFKEKRFYEKGNLDFCNFILK